MAPWLVPHGDGWGPMTTQAHRFPFKFEGYKAVRPELWRISTRLFWVDSRFAQKLVGTFKEPESWLVKEAPQIGPCKIGLSAVI